MKICVISSTVFAVPLSGYGGLEHIAWAVAKGLAAKGHKVSLVAPQGSSCPNVDIIVTGPPGGWDEIKAYDSYWKALPAFDAIIDHSWTKCCYCLKAEGILKAPILGVWHAPVDTMYKVWPPQFPNLPPIEKACPVFISDDQRAHFEALFSGQYGRTCRNGIDLDFYKPLGVKRTNRFLFLARFSSIKGPDLAIEACGKAGVGLDLIGDTSITGEPEYLQKCVEMANRTPDVNLVGPASRGACVYWFSQAHCFLHLNQRFREPLGLAPLEAQACGLPCLAWDHGAMRETVKNGETGWLIHSLNEAVKVIRNCRIDEDMRKKCREWVASQFTVDMMIRRYEELCEEALSTGGW